MKSNVKDICQLLLAITIFHVLQGFEEMLFLFFESPTQIANQAFMASHTRGLVKPLIKCHKRALTLLNLMIDLCAKVI